MSRKRGGGSDFLDALPADGERRLMLAVLIDAIRALHHHQSKTPNLRGSRAWVRDQAWFKADDPVRPFSFVNICSALGLEADYVRRCAFGHTGAKLQVTGRRYAARVEDSWQRQRKDRLGCSLHFDSRPGPEVGLRAGESPR